LCRYGPKAHVWPRLIGSGGGGFAIALLSAGRVAQFKTAISQLFPEFGVAFMMHWQMQDIRHFVAFLTRMLLIHTTANRVPDFNPPAGDGAVVGLARLGKCLHRRK
jgi:hypothetical protein